MLVRDEDYSDLGRRCYSTRPIPKCREDYTAAGSAVVLVNYVCYSDELREMYDEKIQRGELFCLSGEPASLHSLVHVPRRCVQREPWWVDLLIFYVATPYSQQIKQRLDF